MPDRIIEAQAVISAKDNTGDTFLNVAKKLQQIGNGAKASAEVERLSAALSQADATAKKIDGFRVASKGLDAAGLSMAQAKQRAAQLAEQIAGMSKPSATLNGQMAQAERAVTKATDAFKRQGTTVREARSALSEAGVPLNRLAEEQKRLKGVVESTSAALVRQIEVERQAAAMAERVAAAARDQAKAEATAARVAHSAAERRAEGIAHHGVGNLVAGAAAGYVSAHGVAHLGGEVLHAGSELQRARLASAQAGIPEEERRHIEQQALDLSTRFGNISQVGVMELAKELRSVVSDPHHLDEVLPTLAQAKSVLDAKDLSGESSHGLNMLVRGAESIGAAQDPERLKKLIDSYIKAIQVMGETISPEQIFQFDKYSKTAGATMSDRFLMTTGLSLSQEMGGSTAANDIFHAQKDIVGGFQNKHVPLKEMARLGLIDHDDLELTKTGEAKGIKAGHKGVHAAALAQTDLDLWVYQTLLPAMEKQGIKGTQAQLAEVSKIFTGGEADVISKLITQRSALENHALSFPKATGLAASDQNAQDAAVGLQSLGKAVENLAANVSAPIMAPIGTALSGLAGQLDRLAQAAKDHPEIAATAGAAAGAGALAVSGTLAYYVGTGFGLPAAAGQLEAAALHLQGVGGPGSKVPPGALAPAGGLPELAIPGGVTLGAGALFLGGAAAGAYIVKKSLDAQAPGMGGLWAKATLATEGSDRQDVGNLRAERDRLAAEVAQQKALEKIPGTADAATSAQRDRIAQLDAAIDNKQRSLDALHPNALPSTAPLPAARPREAFGPNLPAFHPADDDRASRARAGDADPWFRQLQEQEQRQVFQLGALSDKSGVVLASFDSLNGGAGTLSTSLGTLGTGVGGAAHELDVLALAARTASTAFATLLQAAGGAGGLGGGGGGIVNASFGGGGGGGRDDGSPIVGGAGTVDKTLPVEARALLDTISSGEAHGYNVLNGGGTFGDLTHHPGGRAAGRYQDLPSTWRRISGALGLHDFSPQSQDKGNWWLAQQDYRAHTGRDLLADLRTHDPARVAAIGRALHSTWVSTNGSFARKFDHFLGAQHGGEHPALAAPPLKRRAPAEHEAPSGHAVTAKLDRVTDKLERVASAVERGGLHRVEIKAHRSLVATRTYSRGNMGVTTA